MPSIFPKIGRRLKRARPSVGADGRVRDERFAERERDVLRAANFQDWTGSVFNTPALENEFFEIVDCLESGRLVPEKYYRHRIGVTPDPLLTLDGIKHLHLGGRDSDIIMFLVEYVDRVVILEIHNHSHFATKPPGSVLRSLHSNFLSNQDQSARSRAAKRTADKRAMLKKNLFGGEEDGA